MAIERELLTRMMAVLFLSAWIGFMGCGGTSSDDAKDTTVVGEYTAVSADFNHSAEAAAASALITNTSTITYASVQKDLLSLVTGLSIEEVDQQKAVAKAISSTKELYDNNGCPVITTQGVIVDRTLFITFDDDCDINDIPISGVISGKWDYSSTTEDLSITLAFDTFKVDDRSVAGEMLLEADLAEKKELTINGKLTLTNGEQKQNSIEVNSLSVLCDFNSTYDDPEDDEYTMNGSGLYTDADGKIYSLTFSNVVATFLCYYPVSGTVKVVSANPSYTATVDFGSGSCDSTATVTIGRQVKEIDLNDPNLL